MDIPDRFNAASYFIDRHIEEGRGEKTAVIEVGGKTVTYQELFANVNRLGNGLRKLDIHAEDRVFLLLQDTSEFAFSFFGAIKIGAIPVPVNTLLGSDDYEYFLNDSGARVAIVNESLAVKISGIQKEKVPQLEHIIVVGNGESLGAVSFDTLVKESSPELESELTHKDSPAFWLYSSGSTGVPKACVHRERDMVVCSEQYAKAILEIGEADRCFSSSKLFFAYGLGNALYYPLAVGGTSILFAGSPKPEIVFQVIEQYKPTLFFSVPSQYAALLNYDRGARQDFDLSSIRYCVSAGEALPVGIFDRFKARFQKEILDGIGSTEALQAFITNRPGRVRPGSSGELIPGYEAKIIRENGSVAKPEIVGDLLIKNDAVCAYYWNQPEKTKEAIQDGWLRTGDKYYQDKDGYYWHAGRSDDMLKSSGAWVSPVEVESILLEHPAVLEAAVIGRADDKDGLMRPMACVVLRDGIAGTPELREGIKFFAAGRLPKYKRPYRIEFLKELPRTTTGKIQRFKLRASKDFSEFV